MTGQKNTPVQPGAKAEKNKEVKTKDTSILSDFIQIFKVSEVLEQKVSETKPGLYVFYDVKNEQILYIGKARNLRKRLREHLPALIFKYTEKTIKYEWHTTANLTIPGKLAWDNRPASLDWAVIVIPLPVSESMLLMIEDYAIRLLQPQINKQCSRKPLWSQK